MKKFPVVLMGDSAVNQKASGMQVLGDFSSYLETNKLQSPK